MAISSLTREQVADRAHPDWEARLGSVGQAQSVVASRIDDGTGQPAPHGATGEILVRGAPVMPAIGRMPRQLATHCAKAGCIRAILGAWMRRAF